MKQLQVKQGLPSAYDKHCLGLTEGEIERNLANGQSYVIRLKINEGSTSFEDLIRGKIVFPNSDMNDQVLMKSDGFPTYHLANVVDDHLMEISHVIRGEEWLSSTPKHIQLYQSFGWKPPIFAHLPLLLNKSKKKLSKRDGSASVEAFRVCHFLFVAFRVGIGISARRSHQFCISVGLESWHRARYYYFC